MRYLKQYRAMHETGSFNSRSVAMWAPEIGLLIERHRPATLLDYGCGSGNAYLIDGIHNKFFGGLLPHLYDPASPRFSARPDGQFDGVICADVLEHVPKDELLALIGDLSRYSRQFVFASVCCRPAKKSFPDGTNLHVTVRPFRWWCDLFARHFRSSAELVLREAP